MGGAKQQMMEDMERGWSSLEGEYVCDECLEDYALQSFARDNAVASTCDYCGRQSSGPIGIPTDDLMYEISEGLHSEWGHPDDEGVAYETREGGYQGTVYDSWDLLTDVVDDPFANDRLREEVVNSFMQYDLWCQRDFHALSALASLQFSWEAFERTVKHRTRYVFAMTPAAEDREEDVLSPAPFLRWLGEQVVELGLVRSISETELIWRARVHGPDDIVADAAALGTPHEEYCIYANRMSPAGIPMFYGAFDKDTAVAETYDPTHDAGKCVTVGAFRPARELPVLDLSELVGVPSIFDSGGRSRRPATRFISKFIRDMAEPIVRDGREHIEYVPTQVVTEYFRRVHHLLGHARVHGIIYRSSRCEGKCCVFFFEDEHCCDIRDGWQFETSFSGEPRWWLALDGQSVTTSAP